MAQHEEMPIADPRNRSDSRDTREIRGCQRNRQGVVRRIRRPKPDFGQSILLSALYSLQAPESGLTSEKAMLHYDLRVRWKFASDLRFRAAISEPKTSSFCRISGDLAPSTRKSLAIAIVRFWCAKSWGEAQDRLSGIEEIGWADGLGGGGGSAARIPHLTFM